MVSGLVSSPYDQERTCSGEARDMRRALKSLTSRAKEILSLLEAAHVDSELRDLRGGRFRQGHPLLLFVQYLHCQSQALQLLHQYLEGLRHARLLDVLPLYDRFVGLYAADNVVRFDGEELLKDVGGAVGLQRPHLHLAEALAAELGLAAPRLLRDQRGRSGGAGVGFVSPQ